MDIARAAVDSARYVVAQVNPQMPRTHGNSLVHFHRFDAMVWGDFPLHEVRFGDGCGEAEAKVGENVAGLIRDGVARGIADGRITGAMADPSVPYSVVYHLETLLLFATLVALGPLVRLVRTGAIAREKEKEFGLAELPA